LKGRFLAGPHPRLRLAGRIIGMGDRKIGGITIGGILVIVGIVVALFWSVVLGIIIALIGLIAFGGFVRGRWY
jgi:hypothetical protein